LHYATGLLSVLTDRSVCLPVCNVGVLWPNGWMDQDAKPHCVRLGSSRPKRGTAAPPCTFPSMSAVAKQLDGSRCHMVWRLKI